MELAVIINGSSRDCFVSLPSALVSHIFDQLQFLSSRSSCLVLELTWIDLEKNLQRRAFVGFCGGSSNNSRGLEMSPEMAQCLELQQGQFVNVRPISTESFPKATFVQVEPLSSDDWEILESYSNYLEEQILNQICVIFQDQIFPLWIRDQMLIRLKVNSITPNSNTCVILLNEVEFSVTPKPHQRPSDSTSTTIFDGTKSNSKSNNHLKKYGYLRLQPALYELPFQVGLINSLTLEKLEWSEKDFISIYSSEKGIQSNLEKILTMVRLISDPGVPLGHIQLSPSIFQTFHIAPFTRLKLVPSTISAPSKSLNAIRISSIHFQPSVEDKLTPEIAKILIQEWIEYNIFKQNSELIVKQGCVVHLFLTPCFEHTGNSFASKLLCSKCMLGYQPFSLHFSEEVPMDFFLLNTNKAKSLNIVLNQPEIREPFTNFKEGISLENLGGMETQIKQTLNHLFSIFHPSSEMLRQHLHVNISRGLLFYGPRGSGKSALARAVAKELQNNIDTLVYIEEVSCSELNEIRIDNLKFKLIEIFKRALANRPSLIIFDDLDILITGADEQESLRSTQLTEFLIDNLKRIEQHCLSTSLGFISIIGIIESRNSIHSKIHEKHVFSHYIELTAPTHAERIQIFNKLLIEKRSKSSIIANSLSHILQTQTLNWIGSITEGYLPGDIKQLLDRALHFASMRIIKASDLNNQMILKEDFDSAKQGFVPVSLKGIQLHKSDVQWSDIGGLDEIRHTLKETLEWPSKYPKLFENIPLRPRSGILLFGPPGCGKTMLANAVAKECGLNFLSIKGPELLNKYIGASEQAVRDLFKRAQRAKPCVIFFDEFDSIAPKRGHDSTGVTDRVVNQLLTQLDGVESLQGVYVLAATSRPDLIDPALLRPGRLDKALYCPMPTAEERFSILKAICGTKIELSPEISLEEVASKCEGFSGADLQALIYNSQLEAVQKSLPTNLFSLKESASFNTNASFFKLGSNEPSQQEIEEIHSIIERSHNLFQTANNDTTEEKLKLKPPIILPSHFEQALATTRPSVSEKERKKFEKIYAEFLNSKGEGFGIDRNQIGKHQTLA